MGQRQVVVYGLRHVRYLNIIFGSFLEPCRGISGIIATDAKEIFNI
jgi:hypothetical protein